MPYSHIAGGCFSPYMVISSVLQYVFGKVRREEQDRSNALSLEFQSWMTEHQNQFDDDINELKLRWMREKMQFQKSAKALEDYASKELNYKTNEVKLYFQNYLPIEPKFLPILNGVAKQYLRTGYAPDKCPVNVVLLHTLQNLLDYGEINCQIAKAENGIGNIVVQRWCKKDVAHNYAILNLHAVMANISTLVISPFYLDGKIHFNVAFWEAQTDSKPLIRPAFSIDCDTNLLNSDEGKAKLQKTIGYASTILAGCARDSYMLFSYGLPPTFPAFLAQNGNRGLVEFLLNDDNKDVRQFVIDEYLSAKKCLLTMDSSDPEGVKLLAEYADNAIAGFEKSMK